MSGTVLLLLLLLLLLKNLFIAEDSQLTILKKCRSKFDCLIYEMLFIQKIKPNLNVQSDSVCAKLLIWHFLSFAFVFVVQFSQA